MIQSIDPTSWHLCCDKGLCNRLAAVSDLESSSHGEFSTVAATFKSSNKGPHSPASSAAKKIMNWSSLWKTLTRAAKHPLMAVTRDSRVQRQLLWLPPLPVPGTSVTSFCEKSDIIIHHPALILVTPYTPHASNQGHHKTPIAATSVREVVRRVVGLTMTESLFRNNIG